MKIVFLLSVVIFCTACKSETVKEKINKAGDVAGQTAGELIEGISKGVQKAFEVEVTMDEKLKSTGVELGKTTVKSDTLGTDNVLVAYLIFNQNFKGKLLVTAKDKGKEFGRVLLPFEAKKDEAHFVEFHFGEHVNIDSKNSLELSIR